MARPEWMLGREILDSNKHVGINIRARDVVGAVPLNGEKCVIGRCVLRALDAQYIWVYRSKAYVAWDDDGPIYRYVLPQPLVENVVKVLDDPERDNSEIKPGMYELRAVPPGQRLGVDRRARSDAKKRGPKKDRGHRVMGRITAAESVRIAQESSR